MATVDKMIISIVDSMDMSLSKFWETLKDREDWCGAAVHEITENQTQLNNLNNNNTVGTK